MNLLNFRFLIAMALMASLGTLALNDASRSGDMDFACLPTSGIQASGEPIGQPLAANASLDRRPLAWRSLLPGSLL